MMMFLYGKSYMYIRMYQPLWPIYGGGGGGTKYSSFGPFCTTYRYAGLAIKLYDSPAT